VGREALRAEERDYIGDVGAIDLLAAWTAFGAAPFAITEKRCELLPAGAASQLTALCPTHTGEGITSAECMPSERRCKLNPSVESLGSNWPSRGPVRLPVSGRGHDADDASKEESAK
jgi:hypothetical protein